MGHLGKLGLGLQIRDEVPFRAAATGTGPMLGQEGTAESWPVNEPGEPRVGASTRKTSELKGVGLSARWVEEVLRE